MKKYFSLLLLLLAGLFVFSCTDDDDDDVFIDNDTYAVAYDITGSFNVVNGEPQAITGTFKNALYSSDVVLVYRKTGTAGGSSVWQQIPTTIYNPAVNGTTYTGELDYNFDFTVKDVYIYADGTYNFGTIDNNFKNAYLNNQTFRVVAVPASAGQKVDLSSYEKVAKYYKLDDSKVVKL